MRLGRIMYEGGGVEDRWGEALPRYMEDFIRVGEGGKGDTVRVRPDLTLRFGNP